MYNPCSRRWLLLVRSSRCRPYQRLPPRSALCGSVDSIALSVAQITKTVNDAIKRVEV